MEPITPNPIAKPIQPASQTPAKTNRLLIVILSVLLIIAVAIAGLFYFQIQRLSKEFSKYQSIAPTPSATLRASPSAAPKERVFCKDPRPEVCTMECIQNPPYICGSNGKSYCTVCQACSNKDVDWYELKTGPCEALE